jgi:pimeloyl-ACP methyl ester carboxylesterase
MSAYDVVLLPGVWMPGGEMQYLRRRLESEHGFQGHLFSYASVKGTLDENARLLADFLSRRGLVGAHIVGHSLGGVVALRALALAPDATTGRVVCLGSPLCGSRAARHLSERDWGRRILGHTLTQGVLKAAADEWAGGVTSAREVAVIAGTRPMGMGRLFASFDEANDGTVAVAETRLPGLRDHLCLPVSHTGMVLSRDVADQAAAFLLRGEFLREA